ncbi:MULTISPECIES: hypothetical protein [unclassified Burkholderia]|nr:MULTISPECIES: hypothetical protein [unclassified Burkholderia]MDN7426815.1 hypothetical protein [Burkholderia sp. AU45388]
MQQEKPPGVDPGGFFFGRCAAVRQVGDGQDAFVGDASASLPPTLEIRR